MPADPTLKANALANFGGRVIPSALNALAVPILLPLLGTEAYGLVGMIGAIQIIFTLLDLGLSLTTTREVAQRVVQPAGSASARDLLRTLEYVYWPIGIALGAGLALASGALSSTLVNPEELARSDVRFFFVVLGLSLGARWPVSLYEGVLMGLQLQVRQNILTISAAGVRVVGALAVLAVLDPSIKVFITWHALVSVVEVVAIYHLAWRSLPVGPAPRFRGSILRGVRRFALSVSGVAVLGTLISQADKFLIARYLPLRELAHYSLALTAVGPLPQVAAAVASASLPRLAVQSISDDSEAMKRTYRDTTSIILYVAVGVSLALTFFGEVILRTWTRSPAVAEATAPILAVLSIAYLINCAYSMAYAVAVGRGWTTIPLRTNIIGTPVALISLWLLIPRYGVIAAAWVNLALFLAYFLVYAWWTTRTGLVERGLLSSIALPGYLLLGILSFGATSRAGDEASNLVQLAWLTLGFLVYGLLGLLLLPVHLRRRFMVLSRQSTIEEPSDGNAGG